MTDVRVMCGFCGQTMATCREPWDREAGRDDLSSFRADCDPIAEGSPTHAIFVCSTCGRVNRVQSRELRQRVEAAFATEADVVFAQDDRSEG